MRNYLVFLDVCAIILYFWMLAFNNPSISELILYLLQCNATFVNTLVVRIDILHVFALHSWSRAALYRGIQLSWRGMARC